MHISKASFGLWCRFMLIIGTISFASDYCIVAAGDALWAYVLQEVLMVSFFLVYIGTVSHRHERFSNLPPPPVGANMLLSNIGMAAARGCTMRYLVHPNTAWNVENPFLAFWALAAKCFLFEVIFDFQYYWIHRCMHAFPKLYQVVHKKHHHHIGISPEVTGYTTFTEFLVSIALPLVTSFYLVPMNGLEQQFCNVHMTLQEFNGHIGSNTFPASGFYIFPWLPRWLGIEQYSEDHSMHHLAFTCNYSKRFTLWDKVFGTYRSGVQHEVDRKVREQTSKRPNALLRRESTVPAMHMTLRSGKRG